MNQRQIDFIKDFKAIQSKYHEVYTRENAPEDTSYYELFSENDKRLIIISCDFEDNSKSPIHYYTNHYGNKEFNKLLNKYNFEFNWYDNTICILYDKK
jgi:hypothetical protein